jgi:hypothetical protein
MRNNLEQKVKKAILNIEKKVVDIYNSLNDMNLKLCHIIRSSRPYDDVYYGMKTGKDYVE